jgi:hypothetical protein
MKPAACAFFGFTGIPVTLVERAPISYGFQPVLKPSVFVILNVWQQIIPMVAHTSGIRRFCRCFRGDDTSVVTTQRSAGDSSA